MTGSRICILAVAAAIASPSFAHGPGAHVHGVGRLDIAIEGDTLTLALESPLDNLLGFEHPPTTDRQKAAVRAMAASLNKPAALFVTTPAAECAATKVKLDSPVLEPAQKDAGDGHADLDGEFVFHCAHAEALHDVEIRLFGAFPRLQRLDVQIAGPRGQAAAVLTAKQPRASW